MFSIKHLAAAAAIALAPIAASANILNFSFGGIVESVNDGANANLPGGLGPFNVGDAVAGSFTLDTSLLVGGTGTTETFANAVDNLMVTFDGIGYTGTGPGSLSVSNDHMAGSAAPFRDIIIASFGVSGPDAGGEPVSGFQFSLGGTDAYANGALSGLNNLTETDFMALFAGDNNNGNTKFLTFTDSVNGGFSDVRYDVTSLEITTAAVPLPAPALLLLAGIGGLGALRRRKA